MTFLLRKAGFSWLSRIFGGSSEEVRVDKREVLRSLKLKIDESIKAVKDAILRLKGRYEELSSRTIKSIMRRERERAIIYANELAQIKKMVKKLYVAEMAMEQVKLRFETLEDISDLSNTFTEITGLLNVAKEYVKEEVPALAVGIESLINEAKMVVAQTQDIGTLEVTEGVYYTPEATKVLNELEKMAEEKVSKELPKIPISMLNAFKGGGEEVGLEVIIKSNPVYKVRKPGRLKQLRRLSDRDLEEKVFEYILSHGGFIDIADAARSIGVSINDVKKALNSLREQNKIVF